MRYVPNPIIGSISLRFLLLPGILHRWLLTGHHINRCIAGWDDSCHMYLQRVDRNLEILVLHSCGRCIFSFLGCYHSEALQRALEGLTMATAREQEDAASARVQNSNLQAAVNVLQMHMAGIIPSNDTTVNVVTCQQPPAQNSGQQQAPQQCGTYNGSGNVAPCQSPPAKPQYYQQHQQQ